MMVQRAATANATVAMATEIKIARLLVTAALAIALSKVIRTNIGGAKANFSLISA